MFRNKCKGLLRVSLSMAMAMAATSSLSVGFPDLTAPAMAAQYRKADVDAEIARLHSDSSQTRKVAAFHLSEMGIDAKPAIPELLEALHDPVAFGEAAAALGKIGPDAREAVPSLITCLGDTSLGYDRCYAATALGSIGQSPELAVPALQKMVASNDDPTIRRLSAMALGDFAGQAKEAVSVLIEAVKTGDADMRRAAAVSIGKIGGREHDIPALVALLSDEIDVARLGAVQALALIGSEAVSAVPKLAELLKDSDEQVSEAAAASLGAIGSEAKTALPELKAALKLNKGAIFHENVSEAIKKITLHTRTQ